MSCVVENFTDKFYDQAFNYFKVLFKKKYSDNKEEEMRKEIFVKNYKKVLAHNLNPDSTYKQMVNQFTDLNSKEFNR